MASPTCNQCAVRQKGDSLDVSVVSDCSSSIPFGIDAHIDVHACRNPGQCKHVHNAFCLLVDIIVRLRVHLKTECLFATVVSYWQM